MQPIAHWEDVERSRRDLGHLASSWRDLGSAAGSVAVGAQRIEIEPGRWSTPAHVEGDEEEIFYVLAGSGLSWQDGRVHEIGPSDCLVHRRRAEVHTLRAGPDGLDVLAFGPRRGVSSAVLPRAGVAWLATSWVEVGGEHPWTREAAAGAPEVGELSPRPSSIVALADVPGEERYLTTVGRLRRNLGRAAGSVGTGLQHVTVAPGKLAGPPHCHSAEEELFVVLGGQGACLLGDEEHAVRTGHVVSRPAGTGIAHAFRAGDTGLELLAYGTREPNDICYYPRSNKVSLRGVGVVARLERLDYWDGEE